MQQFEHIKATGPDKGIASICLNRPDVHNAFNIKMIRELLLAFADLDSNDSVRIIILKAMGKIFSAGADLNWMKDGIEQSKQELHKETGELAQLFKDIYESGKVVIASAAGKVMGGANGLLAAADIVISTPESGFAFSEAKLGLIPATIAPYVVQKTGISVAREWFLTSRTVSGLEAYNRGFVHWLVQQSEIENKTEELCNMLMQNGPEALSSIKDLLRLKGMGESPGMILDETVEMLTKRRISSEAQEGIMAFFEKRKPSWSNER